jgi:hypothetical protein
MSRRVRFENTAGGRTALIRPYPLAAKGVLAVAEDGNIIRLHELHFDRPPKHRVGGWLCDFRGQPVLVVHWSDDSFSVEEWSDDIPF